MKKQNVIYLLRPYRYPHAILRACRTLEIGDTIDLNNGFYCEEFKVVDEEEPEIINEIEYRKWKLIGRITNDIKYIYWRDI